MTRTCPGTAWSPFQLDPETLETLGEYDFGGELKSQTVTAHCRIDDETGEMFFFGYEAGGLATRDVAFCVADREGRLVREETFEAPYAGLVHDFAVTKAHVVFPFQPVTTDIERLKQGGPHWVVEPDLGRSGETWRETRLGPPGDFPVVARKDHMKRYQIGYYQMLDPEVGAPRIAGPVGAGPIARIKMPLRLRNQVHGTWVPQP